MQNYTGVVLEVKTKGEMESKLLSHTKMPDRDHGLQMGSLFIIYKKP